MQATVRRSKRNTGLPKKLQDYVSTEIQNANSRKRKCSASKWIAPNCIAVKKSKLSQVRKLGPINLFKKGQKNNSRRRTFSNIANCGKSSELSPVPLLTHDPISLHSSEYLNKESHEKSPEKSFPANAGQSSHNEIHERDLKTNRTGNNEKGRNAIEKTLSCSVCGKRFWKYQKFIEHGNYHLGIRPYSCRLCGKRFYKSGIFEKHKKMHALPLKPNIPCPQCPKVYQYQSSLREHIQDAHQGKKRLRKCSDCNFSTREKGAMMRHVRSHITKYKNLKTLCSISGSKYKCLICKRTYIRKHCLVMHLKTHNVGFNCEICGTTFISEDELDDHVKNYEGKKPYDCGHCGRFFHAKETCLKHVLTHVKRASKIRVEILSGVSASDPNELTESKKTSKNGLLLEMKNTNGSVDISSFKENSTLQESVASTAESHAQMSSLDSVSPYILQSPDQQQLVLSQPICLPTDKLIYTMSNKEGSQIQLYHPMNGTTHFEMNTQKSADFILEPVPLSSVLHSYATSTVTMNSDQPPLSQTKHDSTMQANNLDGSNLIFEAFTRQNSLTNPQTNTSQSTFNVIDSEGKFACDICGKLVKDIKSHSRIHDQSLKYECKMCDKKFLTAWKLYYHRQKHPESMPFKCTECPKGFYSDAKLSEHSLTHTGEKPYACEYCNKRFRWKQKRNDHLRTHTGEKPYACRVCHQKFSFRNACILHERRHTGEKPFQCGTCGKSFRSQGTLRMHSFVHVEEKPHKCDICNASFIRKDTLARHMRVHTDDKEVKCFGCEETFPNYPYLAEHLVSHGDSLFYCKVCLKNFKSMQEMTIHERKNEGKKFTCGECGRNFHFKALLVRHLQFHTIGVI